MNHRILAVVPIAALSAWVIVSCLEPTEINVKLTTNFTCSNVDVILLVGGSDVTTKREPPFTATTSTCKGKNEIGNIYVVPSTKMGAVYVRVVAGVLGSKATDCLDPAHPKSVQCIEAKRSLRFVSHRTLELPIALDEACINRVCPMGQTCDRGACINENVCTENCDAGPDAMTSDAETDAPSDATTPPTALVLAAGFQNACAWANNNKLYCWGDNSRDQLGVKNVNEHGPISISMPALMGVAEIAVGNKFVCATDTQTVQCIGSDSKGQLGDGNVGTKSATAITAFKGTKLQSLTTGDAFACITDVSGVVHCWGSDGTANDYTIPAPLVGDPGLVAIAAGNSHACGFKPIANQLFCWGTNTFGQLAEDPAIVVNENMPVKSVAGNNINNVYAGGNHSGFSMGTGMLRYTYVFGENTFGEIEPANPKPTVFTPVSIGATDDLAFGAGHVCTIALGALKCRGDGNAGQVNGTSGVYPNWQTPTLPNPVGKIVAGTSATCALLKAGDVYCWGAPPVGPIQVTPSQVYFPP